MWRVIPAEIAILERRGLDLVVQTADTAYVFPTAWEFAETGFEGGLWIVQDVDAAPPFVE